MKIFNKPRCTEIKSKNSLRTQLGLLSDTRQQLFKHIQTFQQNNDNKDIKTTITYLTTKNIVQNEQFAYFSCKNENI